MGSFSNTALDNPFSKSMTYRGNSSKHPIAPETGSPAYTGTFLAQSSDLELQANTDYSASCFFRDAPCVSQAIGSVSHTSG